MGRMPIRLGVLLIVLGVVLALTLSWALGLIVLAIGAAVVLLTLL